MFENPYDILSPEEAMDELRIGKNSIYELLNSGKLKGFKVGRNWKIPRKSIDNYIDKNIKESE
ncbi:MAG: helix-turn-helix domain-containing protein [Ruminococcaceae bacterium]|nr:helix-turn-helix domain-containing protein [Oscillospiraceae bacterium]